MGQIWFQNQSIEFEVARLDRFCCPIALAIAVPKSLHRALVTPILAITGDYQS